MSAIRGAISGWTGYDARNINPHRDYPYGAYDARLSRYRLAEAYFYNTVYDQLGEFAARLKVDQRLYKFIRGLYNPVERQNNLISSYTYKGAVDTTTLTEGALPLRFENSALEDPLKQIVKWSNLGQQLSAYVRDAALLGDVAWWIVDDPARGRVRLDLLDPAYIRHVERDEVGNVKAAVIEYEREEEPDVARYQPGRGRMELRQAKTYTYTLKVDRNAFQTFKDGESFAFHSDENGNPLSKWPNEFGFVPLKLAYYDQGRDGWGRNAFFGTPRRQIDELNDQASLINDGIRNTVVPILVGKNINSEKTIDVTKEERTGLTLIKIYGDDSSLDSLKIPLDIASASANRDALLGELERNMPELALQRVRDFGGNLSGVAVQRLFGDAIARIENVRKNLDPPLVAALQMAVTIGAVRGYDGFAGFDAGSFDRGEMELSIAERPVIDDTLSATDRLNVLTTVREDPPALARLKLREMGYSDTDIETVVTELETQTEQRARAEARGAFEAFGIGGGDDET